MLPLSCKEFVKYEDTDGVVFKYRPKDGQNELTSIEVFEDAEAKVILKKANDFLDSILIGWEDTKKIGMPVFPKDKRPSAMFPMVQKTKLIGYWHQANALTVEEKKS